MRIKRYEKNYRPEKWKGIGKTILIYKWQDWLRRKFQGIQSDI